MKHKKRLMRTILILCLFLFLSMMVTFAGSSIGQQDTQTLQDFFRVRLLGALKWLAYGIALGVFILLGIRYVISPANDKAMLKSKFILYFIGIFLIALCVKLPSLVADIAGNRGPNVTTGTAISLAGGQVGDYTPLPEIPDPPPPPDAVAHVQMGRTDVGGKIYYKQNGEWVYYGEYTPGTNANEFSFPPGTEIRIVLDSDYYTHDTIFLGHQIGDGEIVEPTEDGVIEFTLQEDMDINIVFGEPHQEGFSIAVGQGRDERDSVQIPDGTTFATAVTVNSNMGIIRSR